MSKEEVLAFLKVNPDKQFSIDEISAGIKQNDRIVRKYIPELVESGMVSVGEVPTEKGVTKKIYSVVTIHRINLDNVQDILKSLNINFNSLPLDSKLTLIFLNEIRNRRK